MGGLLGAALALVVGYELQVRAGRAALLAYAQRLLASADQMGSETDAAFRTIGTDGLPSCSDADLAFMREFVYNARHVRDIGRTLNGKLLCTSGIGRLAHPQTLGPPDLNIGGMNLTAHAPIMISRNASGFVAEAGGVSVVLNPESYRELDELPMYYTGFLLDRAHAHVLPAFGHPSPLNDAEIIAARPLERNGILYQPLCQPRGIVCALAAESRHDLVDRDRAVLHIAVLIGAVLGLALAVLALPLLQRHRSLERQLRRAVREGALNLVYQPIVDLHTRSIIGAEALVRWSDEDGEPVRPDVFIALAEERGFIGEITHMVLCRALEELRELFSDPLHSAGLLSAELIGSGPPFRVSINISAQDLIDPRFAPVLVRCMAAAHVGPASVGLEITERSTVDSEVAIAALAELRAAGHSVSIDDFGTGYSSLSYLHRLAVDAIKVDRTFTQTVGTEAVTASVVPQILAMAARLDLQVVVEGIETEQQAQYFRTAGRGILGQGWLFGRPVPAAAFKRLLAPASPSPQGERPRI